jgi:hypothetical protein
MFHLREWSMGVEVPDDYCGESRVTDVM